VDFDDSPEEAEFRAEARAWLEQKAPAHETPGPVNINAPDHVGRSKRWQAELFRGGWAGITWPKEFGGRGGNAVQNSIFSHEQNRFRLPIGMFTVASGMVGPTLMQHGRDDQKQRFLEPILRGDEVWCQLFSEPGAGSDLAGLATRAERDGDEFVVNGQKVWNSGAHYSDFGILLARSNRDVPKHRGITYFIVDMRAPGIEVRPLRQITGHAHFNEVFLSDVRIPVANVVGDVDAGWGVAVTTLANERTSIGGFRRGDPMGAIIDLARRVGSAGDVLARDRIANVYIHYELLKYLGFRVQTSLSQGRMPGPESSVMKLALSNQATRVGDLVLALQGAAATLGGGDALDAGHWQQEFLGQFGIKIGGGTDQVQRNVIGERVLGLPGEPRLDKDVPFRSLSEGRGV
jgi:alkylation response protein AidB-like acyl-CoA dehydrogenase